MPASARSAASSTAPSYDVELALAAELGPEAVVVGVDEVGRGALAGPVTVGACAIRICEGEVVTPLPEGVRDSKMLSAKRRGALAPQIAADAFSTSLGWVEPEEIDRIGISAALTEAALRALDGLCSPEGERLVPDAVLLDGSVDVLSAALRARGLEEVRVAVQVKADRDCCSVAGASVVAKVARDAHMIRLHAQAPQYAWDSNKGYGAAVHRAALAEHGLHRQHRASWKLGGALSIGAPSTRASRDIRPAEQEGHR
ncbi:ribonuclease HII [Brachybacterium hainanense]|uniref:Ribonuclease n=1 Tax=Brachybacterium hainanense TaxID=1541174 RepID=A0ABV6RF09_9MICO